MKIIRNKIINKFRSCLGYMHYLHAISKKKYSCTVLKIAIKNHNPVITCAISYKPLSYELLPKEILRDSQLIYKFSQSDSAMIGILSSIELENDIGRKKIMLQNIINFFPKLPVIIDEQ